MSNAQQAEALHRATMPTTSDINALVLEMRQAGTDSTYEIVKEAISRWAAPAAQAVEPVAMTEPDAAIREVIALVNQAVRIGQEAARHDFHIRPTDSVNSLKRLDSAMLTIETKMRALLAGASAPAQPTPEWEKVRRGLTMLMLGFAGRKDCSESAAEAALDAVTEPGMPLAGLRAQRAPAPAAVAVPQVDAIKQVLDLVDDWSQKDFAYAEAKLDAEATDATVTECAYADSCQEEAQKARQAIEAKLRDALAATPPAQALAVPEDCPHLIWYDDQDRKPEMLAGHGARTAAAKRFQQISQQWNAHLFVRIEKNSRDCPHSVAAVHAAQAQDVQRDTQRLDYLQQRSATVDLLVRGSGFDFRIGGLACSINGDIRKAIDAAIAASAAQGEA